MSQNPHKSVAHPQRYGHGFEILTAPWVHKNGIGRPLKSLDCRAADSPVYVSFDIDGLDPAYAPGTGTPVVGGLASWQALEFIRGLGGLDLIGMDVVEVSPHYDRAEITAIGRRHGCPRLAVLTG